MTLRRQLPLQVIVQRDQRDDYDAAVRTAGAVLIEVTTLAELEAAIGPRTCMLLMLGDADSGGLGLNATHQELGAAEMAEVAHRRCTSHGRSQSCSCSGSVAHGCLAAQFNNRAAAGRVWPLCVGTACRWWSTPRLSGRMSRTRTCRCHRTSHHCREVLLRGTLSADNRDITRTTSVICPAGRGGRGMLLGWQDPPR